MVHGAKLSKGVAQSTPSLTDPFYNFLWTITSFSSLSKSGYKYKSGKFGALDCKWNLVLYPKFSMDGKDYLGIFLCLNEVPSHLADCQYNVIHQLSFLNQRTGDNYVATVDCEFRLGDCYGNTIISLRDFQDEKNGYLVNDKCVFGVNVSQASLTKAICETLRAPRVGVTQSTTLMINPFYDFLWTIEHFSRLSKSTDVHKSGNFSSLNFKWKLEFCAKNSVDGEDCLGLYLTLNEYLLDQRQYNVVCQLSLLNQRKGKNHSASVDCELLPGHSCGCHNFISLGDFQHKKNGYLANDKCVFGVKISKALPTKTIYETLTVPRS
ncbi:uncharacterized protein LOC120265000 [Dioscorea cayenensis subsp. rotundata]|uniref:Uncharacterized protein LOC120265000 n=1 Tax=Dioscorea cayennensis subsp. rotundata TaxID=55577 RepID=A0AB40BN79_DIOCR|nr:uncharacterized protein LOC120265000 [Dioscorea cayenensis subsp. rotundata]